MAIEKKWLTSALSPHSSFFCPCTVNVWLDPLWLDVTYTLSASESRMDRKHYFLCATGAESDLGGESHTGWLRKALTKVHPEVNIDLLGKIWCAMLIIWLFPPWTLPSTAIIVPNLSWISCLITLQEGVWLLEKKNSEVGQKKTLHIRPRLCFCSVYM